MHPKPICRRTTDARAFDLVRDCAFGQITLTGPDGLLASHIPVLLAPDVLEKMMRQIVPCRMTITDVQSTFKLNQNKPDDVRLRAADAMESSGIGMETATLAALMHNPPE